MPMSAFRKPSPRRFEIFFDPARTRACIDSGGRMFFSASQFGGPAGDATAWSASSAAVRRATRTAECTRISRPRRAMLRSAPLVHYTVRSLDHYLEKIDRYARWGAEDLFREGRRSGLFPIAFRPFWRF